MTKGKSTTYEERLEIVSYCIEHSNDYTAAIEKYGVSYQQIYSWVRKYNEKGAEGLVDKRGKRKAESEMTELAHPCRTFRRKKTTHACTLYS